MNTLRSFRPLACLLAVSVLFATTVAVADRHFNPPAAPAEASAVATVESIAPVQPADPLATGLLLVFALGLTTTLTSTEILSDVIASFKKWFPALNRMGMDFRAAMLKLNQTYIAHIPTLPVASTYDTSTGYANGAQTGRSLLNDVAIVVSNHKHVPLLFKHLDAIKDQKAKYDECISNAGYALAKAVVDSALVYVDTPRFSQAVTFATADCDFDMLISVQGTLNTNGAAPSGRFMLCNTDVANTLSADTRIISRDFSGQFPDGRAYRRFFGVAGFDEIVEYPDFPSNNGTAINITGEADDELITTASAHGLLVGDIVTLPTLTGGSGLTASATTRYKVLTIPSTTTLTLALESTGVAINFTTDITGGTIKKTENLVAIGCDRRAFSFLGGIPENFGQDGLASQLGIPQTMGYQALSDPDTGLSMAAVSWQATGTGDLYWSPTLVWGWALGRQLAANAAGSLCDYAAVRVKSA